MNKKSSIVAFAIVSLLTISSLMAYSAAAGEGPGNPDAPGPVNNRQLNQNRHQERVNASETNNFQFKNGAQFQLRTNQSCDVSMDFDDPKMAEANVGLEIDSDEPLKMEVKGISEDVGTGITDGAQVQARNRNQNRNQYQVQNQLMLNISTNATKGLKANISAECDGEGSKWAYYDEEDKEWVAVESSYEEGVLTAETDHFSLWTILTPVEESDATDGNAIDSFPMIGLGIFSTLGILGIIAKKRK